MIKRLDLTSEWRSDEEWPESSDPFRKRHLYAGRKQYRKLRVMVDFDILGVDAPVPVTPDDLLAELLEHPLLDVFRYSDTGPPPDLAPGVGDTYEGWVVVRDHVPDRGLGVVFPSGPTSWSLGAVTGNAVAIGERDEETDVYRDLSREAAAERRRADTLAVQIAVQVLHADIYVSNRPYLHARRTGITRGVTLCRPEDALGVLGLYFRAQGVFPIARSFTVNRGRFFWVGARELLPEGWRWFSACVQHSRGSGDESLMLLGSSLIQRFDRALRTRDQIHLSLNQPQNHDTQDAALADLDVTLLFLMACLDVSARVAHRVLGLPSADEYKAAWQNNRRHGWLDTVRQKAPALAAVVQPGTAGGHTLTILRLLRNSVHGTALQGVAYQNRASPLESLIALPAADEAAVRVSMQALGGEATWGAATVLDGRLHLDPGIFVDRLFEHVASLVNNLLKLTPVEDLAHVRLTVSDTHPPRPKDTRGTSDPFAEWIRRSIRLQLGL